MYFTSYFRLFKYMFSFPRYFTVCITYQPPLVRTVSNIGMCSSDTVGTVYTAQHIFENSTVQLNALWNSCEDRACCSSECVLTFRHKAHARGKACVVSEKQGSNLGRYVFLSRAGHADSAWPMTMRLDCPETSLITNLRCRQSQNRANIMPRKQPPLKFFQDTQTYSLLISFDAKQQL